MSMDGEPVKRKPGRPKVLADPKVAQISVRVTPEEKAEVMRLGGADWVRAKIAAERSARLATQQKAPGP
jgi:hypothetical protein